MKRTHLAVCFAASLMPAIPAAAQAPSSPPAWQPGLDRWAAQDSECQAKVNAGQIQTATQLVNCSMLDIPEALARAGMPDADVVAELKSEKLGVAQRADRGVIDSTEAGREFTAINKGFAVMIDQRSDARIAKIKSDTKRIIQQLQSQSGAQSVGPTVNVPLLGLGSTLISPGGDRPSITTSCRPNGLDGSFICDTQ